MTRFVFGGNNMKKRFWLVLAAAILSLLLIGSAAADSDSFKLVTNDSDLHDGDKIILVSDDGEGYYTVGANFANASVNYGTTITETSSMLPFILHKTNGGWILETNGSYVTSSGSTLTLTSAKASAAVFSIAVNSNGTAKLSTGGGDLVFAQFDGEYRFGIGSGGSDVLICSASLRNEFGDGLWWTYFNEKLTVGGEGAMPNYGDFLPKPWNSNATAVEIKDGVTSIGSNAFFGFSKLTAVTVPDSVTAIGYNAFCRCSKLEEIAIPNSVTSIGDEAFRYCSKLTTFNVPTDLTYFGSNVLLDTAWWNAQSDGLVYCDYVLAGCKGTVPQIVTVKDGTKLIASSAFYNNKNIVRVNLADSVTDIGRYAFQYCSALTTVNVGSKIKTIGNYAFKDCKKLTAFSITDSVKTIGKGAFSGCSELAALTLGNGLVSIGEEAFKNCGKIEEVAIPDDVTVIEPSAFAYCSALKKVTLGSSVTKIAGFAFQNCASMTDVTLPKTLRTIESSAFSRCSSLSDVWYEGKRSDRDKNLTIQTYDNWDLTNAAWHYTQEEIAGKIEWNASDVKFKGTTAYVIANGSEQTPRFTVKNKATGAVIDPTYYNAVYRENVKAGTGYVFVTFKDDYKGTCSASFKIYLPATTATTVENVGNGIKLTWKAVDGAAGYVIYRRAWSSTTDGWTDFVRWNNTTALNWTDTNVYAGTRYQYGVKAYFARRTDPVTGTQIGGNVGDNYNLGEVGPLKTTVRITTRTLSSVTAGSKQMTVKWSGSSVFTGYQIQYATDSAFTKNAVATKITNPKTVSTVIKSLTKGTTYYVRVRSYHEFNGMTYFGEWSNVRSCKVK